jgi:hypothetical protein
MPPKRGSASHQPRFRPIRNSSLMSGNPPTTRPPATQDAAETEGRGHVQHRSIACPPTNRTQFQSSYQEPVNCGSLKQLPGPSRHTKPPQVQARAKLVFLEVYSVSGIA